MYNIHLTIAICYDIILKNTESDGYDHYILRTFTIFQYK